MSAQDLTFSELHQATVSLVDDGPVGHWFRGTEVGRMFGEDVDRLRAVIAAAPAESSELGQVTADLAVEDAVHDDAIRFGDGVLENYEENHHEPALRVLAAEARAIVFPDGVSLVNKSYAEEAGRAASRDAVRTPEVRAKLARFAVVMAAGAPIDLDRWMDAVLQPSTRRLGALLARRDALSTDPSVPSAATLLNAKREFIALVVLIFSMFRRLDARLDGSGRIKLKAIKDAWQRHVSGATERATEARRRRAADAAAAPPVPRPGS